MLKTRTFYTYRAYLLKTYVLPPRSELLAQKGSAMLFPAIVPQCTPLAPADLLKLSVAVVVKIYVQARGTVVRRMD